MITEPTYYAVIPAKVRYDNNLSSSEKLFYGEITVLTNSTGKCWASNSYFSNLYKVSTSTISSWVKKLNEAGYISVSYEREGKQIKKRIIQIMGSQKIDHPIQSSQKIERGVVRKHEEGSQNILGGYSENLKENNTSSNNIKENIIKQNSTTAGWNIDLIENKILDVLRNYDIHPEEKRYVTALEYYKEAGMFEGISQKMKWDERQKQNWWTVLGRIEKTI